MTQTMLSTTSPLDWEQFKTDLNDSQLYSVLSQLKAPIFFDSSNSNSGEYDIISGNPTSQTISSGQANFSDKCFEVNEFPSSYIEVPFCLGYAGLIKYDHGYNSNYITDTISEPLLSDSTSSINLYTWSLVRKESRAIVTFSPLCMPSDRQIIKQLLSAVVSSPSYIDHDSCINNQSLTDCRWKTSSTKAHYERSFLKIKDYIDAGDCYQVNLTQRFEAKTTEEALPLYYSLRQATSTPFSAFFEVDENTQLLSFSPERFLKIENKTIKSSPIKGTKPNNGDDKQALALFNSEKDRSENLMIVDLLRNDINKVAEPHSVKVERLFGLESYNNVHHLVSDITGKLKQDTNELEALLSCFPGGSITGAPKKRAMEIIQETEAHRRDAYCGSLFYWNYNGNLDSNILIRTVIKTGNKLYCWAGGGITADSDCNDEFNESLAKVANITGLLPDTSD